MKRSTRIVLGVISVLAVAVCAVCIFFIVQFYRGKALSDRLGSGVSSGIISTALNDEVYAWIEVPGTVINYAVVQSATDDLFYINHAVDKSYFSGGSIFSQRYNTTTFQDSMTVLYGHNSRSQAMFAQLNNFADASFFEQNQSIYIYTPEKVYEYQIFAAYPHSSDHLLLCNDFNDPDQFAAYFDSLADGVNCNYRRDLFPQFGDKVLTLSTCYRQNRTQRFLVQGVLTQEYTVLKK